MNPDDYGPGTPDFIETRWSRGRVRTLPSPVPPQRYRRRNPVERERGREFEGNGRDVARLRRLRCAIALLWRWEGQPWAEIGRRLDVSATRARTLALTCMRRLNTKLNGWTSRSKNIGDYVDPFDLTVDP